MTTTALATLSIQKDPLYSQLRICAQTCVDKGSNNSDLEGHLECGDSKILDSCFCRTDLRPKATTFLSSCVISRCGYNNVDYTSALQLYNGYCSFKTTSVSAKTTSSTKSSASTSSTKAPTSASTAPSLPTQTSTPITADPARTTFATQTAEISETSTTTLPLPITTETSNVNTVGSDNAPVSAGAIAGIVIGGIITLILGFAILMWIRIRTQRGRTEGDSGGQEAHRPWKVLDDDDQTPVTNSVDLDPITGTMGEMKAQDHDRAAAVEICDTGFRAELPVDETMYHKREMA